MNHIDIAVLSDIHSNYVALEQCIKYAVSRDINNFIFLGDYVGELAYSDRTMQVLYDMSKRYRCFFIKGNKEDYMLDYRNNGEEGWKDRNSSSGALLYLYNSLDDKFLEFFTQLQSVQEISIGEMPPFAICHGSPYHISEKLLKNNERTIEIMNSMDSNLILCGHTHIQMKFAHNEKCVLNPGAVGVPLNSDGKTQFMILHGNDGLWSEEFVSLTYDVDRVIREMQEVKLFEHAPYWSKITEHLLYNGKISHGRVLERAMGLCRVQEGSCIWPDIPERFWAQAVSELLGIEC